MASKNIQTKTPMQILFAMVLLNVASATGRVLLNGKEEQETMLFQYHNGPLLTGKMSINLIWYGQFNPSQKAIIADFIASFGSSSQHPQVQPSVAMWWENIEQYYYTAIKSKKPSSVQLFLGSQIFDQDYSLGKSLKMQQIEQLAAKGDQMNCINVVLTSSDVAVEGFCSSKCGTHGSLLSKASTANGRSAKFAYIWVGNSQSRCPGQCAWPFHQPIYGPQSPSLVAPNNDMGLDGMVINLASLLAGTITNPFGNGYYQGPADAPLEAASACTGIYAKGAYPGYAGDLLVDPTSGASYNAHGTNEREFLLPALYDPSTSTCSTLV
ncbi:hypothetical protein ACH5RR_026903 [Cinchona calisaya]|uniref:Protein EXORDIUM-like n=1 Tax=Cinchona calisaya TaxID=153742 RepID=A0ABD2Z3Y1_9GENT